MAWTKYHGEVVSPDTYFVYCSGNAFSPLPNSADCPGGQTWVQSYDFEPVAGGWQMGSCAEFDCGVYVVDGGVEAVPAPTAFAGASGGSASSSVRLEPFDFSPAQQAEAYSGMLLMFGLLLVVLSAVWGLKQLARLFNWHGHGGD